jgi:3-methyladenine DNA glycosylase/8-oxoguanine DNA glycosylase
MFIRLHDYFCDKDEATFRDSNSVRKALDHLKKSDPVLRAIIARIGPCRMQFGPPEFHNLAEAIVYQQLNGKAAETIFNRFAALAGEPLTPEGILKLSDEQMRGAGLSKQKSAYLKDLATKTAAGLVDFSRLSKLSDEQVIEHLTQVKGIGVWTAQMFLMFTLRRQNVLPAGDFGVRMAMYKHYLDAQRAKTGRNSSSTRKKSMVAKKARKRKIKLPTPQQMEKIAKCWEPYRSVACWYLWRSLDTKTL